MNKKGKPEPKSMLEKRGFYTALYSCIVVVLIIAAGITYSSFYEGNEMPEPQNYTSLTQLPNQITAQQPPQSTDRSGAILVEEGAIEDVLQASAQAERAASVASSEIMPQVRPQVEVEAPTHTQAQNENDIIPVMANSQEPLNLNQNQNEVKNEAEKENKEDSEKENNKVPDKTAELQPELNLNTEQYIESDAIADPVFNIYTGNEDMLWPVFGEIVMEFSVDRLILDKTLNHFRTNDNICIGANVGEQVKASADGVIKSISNTRELGNTIVIEHGNGWFTTYGQLQDGILVDEGDVVSEGQVIGGVGEPSVHSTLLGSHLLFKVTKDNEAIDPNVVLALNTN